MDKDTIRTHLTQLTEKEIPDVNLLPNIQNQLKQQLRPRRQRVVFQIARTVAVAVILMMASVIGYAVVISGVLQPTTIPQGLISSLEQEQTIDGMTATLNWAYADEHRIALEVSTRYDATETAQGNQQLVTLATTDGQDIPANFGGGGGGNSPSVEIVERSFMSSFDARGIAVNGDTIDLVLTMQYGYVDPSSPSSSSSGGGGGGGNQPAQETVTDRIAESDAPDRTFEFVFSVPYTRAVDGIIAESTQTLNAVDVTVQDARITPSMTIATLCSAYLSDGWMPRVYLQSDAELRDYIEDPFPTVLLNGQPVYMASAFTMMPIEDEPDCREIAIQAPFTAESTTLIFGVEGFFKLTEEDSEADVIAEIAYFEGLGFDLSYEIVELPVMGGDPTQVVIPMSPSEMLIVTIDTYPETLNEQQAISYISQRMLTDRIDGTLTYAITVE